MVLGILLGAGTLAICTLAVMHTGANHEPTEPPRTTWNGEDMLDSDGDGIPDIIDDDPHGFYFQPQRIMRSGGVRRRAHMARKTDADHLAAAHDIVARIHANVASEAYSRDANVALWDEAANNGYDLACRAILREAHPAEIASLASVSSVRILKREFKREGLLCLTEAVCRVERRARKAALAA